MLSLVHRVAGILATVTIAVFLLATIVVESFGSPESVAGLKALIVMPGLWLLIPAIAVTGASGFRLAGSRGGRLVAAKKKRMPIIAANGLLVLVPSALFLDARAAAGLFDAMFYAVQVLELLAGAVNLVLMVLNARDGMRLSGRLRPANAARVSAADATPPSQRSRKA